MKTSYQFRILPVLDGAVRRFQLHIGLAGDYQADCIPVHRSAFAQRLPLEPAHSALADAHLELSRLLACIEQARG